MTPNDTAIADDVEAPQLLRQLVSRHGAQWVDGGSVDAWQRQSGHRVLLFAGDPVRFPEGLDVAVVLPELVSACAARGKPLDMGVAVPAIAQELALRFGSQRWPTLMFFCDGNYQTTVSGMHDWTDFCALVETAWDAPASRPPTVGIAVVAAASAAPGCH